MTLTENSTIPWDNDPANPFNWSIRKKWRVMGISCLLTFLAGLNSTSITTAFPEIGAEFDINDSNFEYTFFMVTAWNFAAAVFPMISLPLMDSRGTYFIYSISYILFVLFVIPQALARNFATLLVTRAFAGAFGGTIQNAAEGIAANLFKTSQERLTALTIYIFALVAGVTLGPVQGAVVGGVSWRWVFWIQLIIYSAALPLAIFGLQETRGTVIRSQKVKTTGRESGMLREGGVTSPQQDSNAKATFSAILEEAGMAVKLLSTEPTVFFFMLWCAFSFGLIFISTESVTQVFTTTFVFATYKTGLIQVSMFVGEIIGFPACMLSNRYYARSASECSRSTSRVDLPTISTDKEKVDEFSGGGCGKPVPERSLHLSIPATVIGLSGGLFVYAWASQSSLPWIVPSIGLAMQGFAIQIIVTAVTIYITDNYERYAASAIAAIAFGENSFAAFLPLASLPMYTDLGYKWSSSLLAFLALVLALAPIVLVSNGSRIRARSKAIRDMAW